MKIIILFITITLFSCTTHEEEYFDPNDNKPVTEAKFLETKESLQKLETNLYGEPVNHNAINRFEFDTKISNNVYFYTYKEWFYIGFYNYQSCSFPWYFWPHTDKGTFMSEGYSAGMDFSEKILKQSRTTGSTEFVPNR